MRGVFILSLHALARAGTRPRTRGGRLDTSVDLLDKVRANLCDRSSSAAARRVNDMVSDSEAKRAGGVAGKRDAVANKFSHQLP